MTRFLFVFTLLLPLLLPLVPLASGARAQGAYEHDACARDVARFCRAHMGEGDQVVLACLKEHRARISKACNKVMTEHGQ